jgi:D-alanine-D-alanine ligase
MRVAVLHDDIPDTAAADARDVLVQADAVAGALERLGHEGLRWPCTLNLDALRRRIDAKGPDLVFNLVESVNGRGSLIHLPLFCLDAWGVVYTGASAAAMLETSNKIMAKTKMVAAGLPTPPWEGPFRGSRPVDAAHADETGSSGEISTWIIKSVWEHASIGLDASGLVRQTRTGIRSLLPLRAKQLGWDCFAEGYIHGREFNLSLLAGLQGPEVLPPAEILFVGFSPEKPKIVDYRAKWDENSYEFHHTPRRFDFNGRDADLLQELENLALKCWHVFGLAGYARVDFRVDEAGRPWILEINANPCLSPDAGFAAAAARAGLTMDEVVRRILDQALGHQRD